MGTPHKLNVYIAMLCYGGNGGVATIIPQIASWFAKNYLLMKTDPRIGQVFWKTYGGIPLLS